MPIYEYQCPECGRFEMLQKISDAPLAECPACLSAGRHSTVKRLVSLSAFHLKGSGWYKTDYSANNSGGNNGSGHAPKTEGATAGAKDAQSKDSSGSPKENSSASTPPTAKASNDVKEGGSAVSKDSTSA
jgi:putative FmdB family regulatory protein